MTNKAYRDGRCGTSLPSRLADKRRGRCYRLIMVSGAWWSTIWKHEASDRVRTT